MNLSPTILNKIRDWKNSALIFVNDTIQMKSPNPGIAPGPSKQQIQLLQVFGKPDHKRITIRSGHGTGKDTSASWCILNFFMTRPFAKVVCTAPTARQLADILWSELSKWGRRSIFYDDIVIQKDKIFHKHAPKEWWIRAVSTSAKSSAEEQAETLAGFHGDHLLIVIDEASGVPDPVFIPLEGAMTQEDNHVLMIGNMTKNSGYFYDSHFHPKISKQWTKFHWDSRESTNVQPSTVQYFRDKYGEDSNIFRIRIAGEPPLESERTLIPLSWALACVGNAVSVADDEPRFLAVDVARYGEDKSIVLPRKGLRIDPWESFHSINTISLAGFVKGAYEELEADGIAIDEIGVGAGVVDWLVKHGHLRTFGVNVANKSSDITKFHNLRSELWCAVRDKCMRVQYSFPDITVPIGGTDINIGHELANELSIPTYDFNAQGGIKVESKKEMKLRGYASPNIADALCLSEYFHTTAYRIWAPDKKSKFSKLRKKRGYRGPHSYMTA